MTSAACWLSLLVALAVVQVALGQWDKSKAVGPCINGKCPEGNTCHEEECYPSAQNDDPTEEMFNSDKSRNAIGPCVNDLCPAGHDCIDKKCYKSAKRSANESIGPCVNDKCPTGYKCNTADYKCY